MSKLSRAVLFDVFIAACIFLWKAKGIDGARIFLEAYLWFVVAMHWVVVIFAGKKHLFCRSPVLVAYDCLSTVVLIVALLWLGMVTLPIVLFIGWILVSAKLDGVTKRAAT